MNFISRTGTLDFLRRFAASRAVGSVELSQLASHIAGRRRHDRDSEMLRPSFACRRSEPLLLSIGSQLSPSSLSRRGLHPFPRHDGPHPSVDN
jgi:hypothetical protein